MLPRLKTHYSIHLISEEIKTINFICRSQLTNGSLYINSVIEEQRLTGAYQCMATLPNVGSIVSRTAKLTIASKYFINKMIRTNYIGSFKRLSFVYLYIFIKSFVYIPKSDEE